MTRLGSGAMALALVLAACGGAEGTLSGGTEATGTGAGAGSTTAGHGVGSTTAGTGAGSTTAGAGGASSTAGTGPGSTTAGTASTSSGAATPCMVTLSGAVTGSFTCNVITAWSGNQNQTGIAFTPSSALPMGVSVAEGGGTVDGEITTMSYAYSDFKKGGYAVDNKANSVWSSGPDNSTGPQTMTITSVKTDINTPNGKTYTVHGTFDATCPWVNGTPDPGTTVTVHIDF